MSEAGRSGERLFRGIPVSSGVSCGKILVLGRPRDDRVPERHVPEAELSHQTHRLEQALVETRHEIVEVQRQVTKGLATQEASISDAHVLALQDPTLIEKINRII